MLLPFTDGLVKTHRTDEECARLADKHYSRQSHGHREFCPPGVTLVLRDNEGRVVFGWIKMIRDDGQEGINCFIFRNESARLSSEIIKEAEHAALRKWGATRAFTYVDPQHIRSHNPGCCFKKAGWRRVGKSKSGKLLLEKFIGI